MKTRLLRSSLPYRYPFKQAFSLVEVMLALAIASLGFITMLGLLPQGLQLARSAAEIAAESRINQKLSGELLTAPWSQLTWTDYSPNRYFNDQGIELSQDEIANNADAKLSIAYVASIQMPSTPLDYMLPEGEQSQKEPKTYLRRMRICIASSPTPNFDFATAPDHRLKVHTVIIAKIEG